MQVFNEAQSISSRFKKTFDGIFSSPAFVGNFLQGAVPEKVQVPTVSYFGFRSRGKSTESAANVNQPTVDSKEVEEVLLPVSSEAESKRKPLFSTPQGFFSRKSESADVRPERIGDDEKSEFESFVESVAEDNESDEVEVLISATSGYSNASQSANVTLVDFDFDQDPKALKGLSLETFVIARLNELFM